jgi:hypothetical protein
VQPTEDRVSSFNFSTGYGKRDPIWFETQLPFHHSGSSFPLRNKCLCVGKSWHPEQRAACAPDAFRLCCAGDILDPTRVEHCLRQNKSDLSDACRSVFEQNAGPVASSVK